MSIKNNFKQACKELVTPPREATMGNEVEESIVVANETPKDAFDAVATYNTVKEYAVTIIAEGIQLNGSIKAEGAIDLRGDMTGNVSTKSDFDLSGKLVGDMEADNVRIQGGRMKGDLRATGHVLVDEDSVLLGNLRATSMEMNGRVKGDLEVKGFLVLGSTAVVNGKISAGRLLMQEGAICCGQVQLTSESNVDAMFEDAIKDM